MQETLIRAWRGIDRFEGRDGAAFVALPHRHERLLRPPERGEGAPCPADGPRAGRRGAGARQPAHAPGDDVDPADPGRSARPGRRIRPTWWWRARRSGSRSSPPCSIFPPRQRATLILCEVLHWKASEVAELLDTSVASVNSALQRARATLSASPAAGATEAPLEEADRELLARYVEAFERYDIDALVSPDPGGRRRSRCRRTTCGLHGRDDIPHVVVRARASAAAARA